MEQEIHPHLLYRVVLIPKHEIQQRLKFNLMSYT